MSRDLEETLAELGPEYRTVVDRLRAAYPDVEVAAPRRRRVVRRPFFAAAASAAGLLAAASVALALFFCAPHDRRSAEGAFTGVYSLAYSGDVESLLRTQRADGSWDNDFLTRQNAAALRFAKGLEGADVAYRRAVRYLRTKGLSPLSDAELHDRGAFAAICAARS
jgi:hypothetical protein